MGRGAGSQSKEGEGEGKGVLLERGKKGKRNEGKGAERERVVYYWGLAAALLQFFFVPLLSSCHPLAVQCVMRSLRHRSGKFRLSNINKAHPPHLGGGKGMRLGTNTTTSPEDGDRAASEWAQAQQQ